MRPSDDHHGVPTPPAASLSDDQLRSLLHAEAAAHRPDREAMLARITSTAINDPAPARQRGSRLRLAVVGALVALFGGGGFAAQWALAGQTDNDQAIPSVSTPATPSATPSTSGMSTSPPANGPSTKPATAAPIRSTTPTGAPATPTATGTGPGAATGTPVDPDPALTKGQPGYTRVEQGPLWSDGSIDPASGDTQGAGVITLKSTEKLTALTVTVRVAKTPGLTSRGGTKSVPGASVSTDVTERSEALLYTFTLASADEIAPGTYTFTAKYSYPAGGRNAGGDTYEAVATTAGGQSLDVYGNFYPAG
ncbi:hypothetical protein GCM10010168_65070 [Actinoplanes ianthinogenes]|uniref:Uncharacterized protein n=1 Tax=Actinoplanes ianthinogenes TaxID=122358 RepID=A0ABM7LSC7_9ACTN|nr:hypothetical protein [Actinoplanes ianthinogenes]BCJ42115.1 hypothetical protein Aiant_27720 [Actinoplanes ianthinogenes]GGR37590.1 hypothetical protein GCM10010168_65070 [Actinoplanes ianthinogenes]